MDKLILGGTKRVADYITPEDRVDNPSLLF